ncbi:HAD-IIB family hydrolase [Spiroplasma tabanidicola]|uniref:HAD superfamily hydrolase n=1 Tax=Spiroplasma tabanidicola TaxID=324079 RepID=A0A6I6CIV7_9MOLU|nr:HAD-IIB family hydrolase [Spiroplasma tabanidicola]QGS52003.1 hypothetical protein STABA_v1c06420 [Spiroplasma tabanidicola]
MSSFKKIVCSDLDGTIITKENELLKETKKDIQAFMIETNNAFSVVTGRQFFSSKNHIKDIGVTLPVITINGSSLIDPVSETLIDSLHFNKEEYFKILDIMLKHNIRFSVVNDFQIFCLKTSIWNKHFRRDKFKNSNIDENIYHLYDDFNELYQGIKKDCKYYNSVFIEYETKQEFDEIEKLFESYNFSKLTFAYFDQPTIEYFKPNVNKLSGLKMLANYLKVDLQDIYVFGDQVNDIPMFKGLKNNFAVGNAVPEIISIANEIIDNINNNGVGKKLIELKEKNIF